MRNRIRAGLVLSLAAPALLPMPAAHAGTAQADEYIRTQCQTVAYTEVPSRKAKFCDKQYYVWATGQRKHVLTITQEPLVIAWRLRAATANRTVSIDGPINTASYTVTITDSWSSSLTAKSQVYIKSSWDVPYALATFRM